MSYQYRMCEEIMDFSNYLVYDHQLKCLDTNVSEQKLNLPFFPKDTEMRPWPVRSPSLLKPFLALVFGSGSSFNVVGHFEFELDRNTALWIFSKSKRMPIDDPAC